MRKLRLREVKRFAGHHPTTNWQSLDLKQENLDPGYMFTALAGVCIPTLMERGQIIIRAIPLWYKASTEQLPVCWPRTSKFRFGV